MSKVNNGESGTSKLYTWAFLPSMILYGHYTLDDAVPLGTTQPLRLSTLGQTLTIICSNTMMGLMCVFVCR